MRTTLRARFVASEIHALLFVFMWVFYSLSSQALADGLSGPLFTILLVADLPISFVAFGVMFTSTRYGIIAAALWGVLGTAWWFLIGVAIDARVRKYQESRASNQGLTTTRVHSERKYSIRIEASIAASVVALLLAVSLALAWNGYHGHFDKGAIGNLVFAPDGQSIAFVRSQDNSSIIERLDLLTGRTAAITKAIPCKVNSPAYSPDAKQIAVACASGNRSRILLVDADGDNLHPLFSSSEGRYDFAPHFSTDGREIYFAKAVSFSGLTTTTSAASPDSWDVYMATLDGANEIPVTDRHFKLFEVSYSHDGKTFAVSGDLATGLQTGLYSISEPSKSEIPIQPVIPQAAGSPVISDIVLASDGRGVYFMAGTGEKAFDYDVYRMDVAGGAVQKLTAANGYATDLCVSDDGKTAAFLRWTSEWGSSPNLSRLYTLDLATKSTRASQVTGTQ